MGTMGTFYNCLLWFWYIFNVDKRNIGMLGTNGGKGNVGMSWMVWRMVYCVRVGGVGWGCGECGMWGCGECGMWGGMDVKVHFKCAKMDIVLG